MKIMRNLLVTLCAAVVVLVGGPGWAQATSSVQEIFIPHDLNPGEGYRIPILSLLHEGESVEDFVLLQEPSLGLLMQNGEVLVFEPLPDFHLAQGDAFIYAVGSNRVDKVTRMAYLSPQPPTSASVFASGFEQGDPDWDGDGLASLGSGFQVVSPGIVGGRSLRAVLHAGDQAHLHRADDLLPPNGGSSGSWGGETQVIVCPDDDPPEQFPLGKSTVAGEVVVYRAVGSQGQPLIQLRMKKASGQWKVRLETVGPACVAAGPCESEELPLAAGIPEKLEVRIPGGHVDQDTVHLLIPNRVVGSQQSVSLNTNIDWREVKKHQLGVMDLVGLEGERLTFDEFRTIGFFNPFDQRISDDFESGYFVDDWDDLSQADGLVVSSRAALSGFKGLELNPSAVAAGSGSATLREISANREEAYGARFDIDTSQISLAPGQVVRILGGASWAGHPGEHLVLTLRGTIDGNALKAYVIEDGGNIRPLPRVLLNEKPHTIVLRWTAGSPGRFTMWRDGSRVNDLATINNPLRRIKSVRLGVVNINSITPVNDQLGYIKLDGFVAW